MTTNLATYDNPFWVGPLPEPLLYPISPSVDHSPPRLAKPRPKPKQRPRPSLDPSPDNPFLNSDNPFLANSTGTMSGSGSEALLRSFKESQRESKSKERKIQIKKEGKMDEGSPGSSVGMMELDHIAINRDLAPSQEQILGAQERVGGSSMPPEVEERMKVEDQHLTEGEGDSVIKAEDIRAEMSTKTKKAGKRTSIAAEGTEVVNGPGEIMTRAKKARLSRAAQEEVVKLEPTYNVGLVNQAGPSTTSATTTTTTTGVAAQSTGPVHARPKPTKRVSFDGTCDPPNWRAERHQARTSLPGPPNAGPSKLAPSRLRSSLDDPSTEGPADEALEKEVMNGIYANMVDNSIYDTSIRETSMGDVTMDLQEDIGMGKGKGKSKGKGKGNEVLPDGEVRAGRWRKKCPKTTLERLDRVMHQRMFMLDRTDRLGGLMETFKVLGSTGNVYTIKIGPTPTCDCPDAGKGNIPCKHIIFIFIKVLKVPQSSDFWYQKSLLDSELQTIYSFAPPAPQDIVLDKARTAYLKATGAIPDEVTKERESGAEGGKRKEAVGEDCPVCYEEMTDADVSKKLLVWDESDLGCGKALHTECFRNWKVSLASKGTEISCVWCRCPWPTSGKTTGGGGGVSYTQGGYMNIADLAGVSRVRDTSSYYHGPIRGRRMDEARYEDD